MRKMRTIVVTALLALAMTFGLTMASGASAQATTYRMQIYEIWYNSPGPDYGGSGTQTDRYWNHSWYIWNNTGDTAILRNQHGITIGSCTYKGTAQGYVYC